MIKAIIFDMDGTIIDSSPVHYENWNSIFEERWGITLPKKDFGMQFGKSGLHFTEFFLRKFGLDIDPDELDPLLRKRFHELKHKIQLKPHLIDTLKALNGYKVALASGASREMVEDAVARFCLSKYFDFLIGGDEVREAKPHPEIFIRAAHHFHAKPYECVVVEDALLGIQAAVRAGMHVIAVEDEFTRYQDHSMADAKIRDLSELVPALGRL